MATFGTLIRIVPSTRRHAMETLAAGDRIQFHHAGLNEYVWGTVVEVTEFITDRSADGRAVLHGVNLKLHCNSLTTWNNGVGGVVERTIEVNLQGGKFSPGYPGYQLDN